MAEKNMEMSWSKISKIRLNCITQATLCGSMLHAMETAQHYFDENIDDHLDRVKQKGIKATSAIANFNWAI